MVFSLNYEAGIVSAITNGFHKSSRCRILDILKFPKVANTSKLLCGNSKTSGSSINRYPVYGVWMQGLGRMFLRHLRRTRLLVHVVDASNPDPVQDYTVLREVSLVSVCIIE